MVVAMSDNGGGRKLGRRTLYDQRKSPRKAAKLAAKGMTNQGIARAMGIGITTLYEWQNLYPKFAEAIKDAKRGPDEEVEAALFKAAKGYDWIEQKFKVVPNSKTGTPQKKLIGLVHHHVPPNVTAAIYWTKNRDPKRWRDVRHIDAQVGIYQLELERLSEEELDALEGLLGKAEVPDQPRLIESDRVQDAEFREDGVKDVAATSEPAANG